jgi:DNA (cytosine-5)-methyltransferase 1
MTCAWQVEIDEYCRRVLEKHWPGVRRHDDVRTFPPWEAFHHERETWKCDLIAGGFPCQDISPASGRKTAGIDGQQSRLWREFIRVLRNIRPRFALVENSPIVSVRGLGRILGELSECGFDAEWSVVSACAMGAPQTRERMFIVAYPKASEWGKVRPKGWDMGLRSHLLHAEWNQNASWHRDQGAGSFRAWSDEPGVRGVAHGVPHRVDRINGLGNAVVPQVAEWIGRRIMESQA